jgi:hypothetical protein
MTVCKDIKTFSRTHEHIADLFSVLAVVLIFATVWAVLEYHQALLEWWTQNMAMNGAILVGALVLDVFLVLGFLAVGSARFAEGDERCFGATTAPPWAPSVPGFITWKTSERSIAETA